MTQALIEYAHADTASIKLDEIRFKIKDNFLPLHDIITR